MELDSTAHWDLAVRRSVSRLFLLAALAERPMHGYELAQAVAELSGQCCAPGDASIYPAIRELTAGGYVTCEVQAQGNRHRNVCTLTARGHDALAAAATSWGRVLPHLSTVIESTVIAQAPGPAGVGSGIDRMHSARIEEPAP